MSTRSFRIRALRSRVGMAMVVVASLVPLAYGSPLSSDSYDAFSAEFNGVAKSPVAVHLCDGGKTSTKVIRARVQITSASDPIGEGVLRVAISEGGSTAIVERVTLRGRGALSGSMLSGFLAGGMAEDGSFASSGTVRGVLVSGGVTLGRLVADLSLTIETSTFAVHGDLGAAEDMPSFGTLWQTVCSLS